MGRKQSAEELKKINMQQLQNWRDNLQAAKQAQFNKEHLK